MNILSLFDGMSCGQIALNRANIPYNNYYASEIDKYAIEITQKNYPETIQMGDITRLTADKLPQIDLLMGGSPCQGFSFAGKQLNFEDPRSKLFFEFVRLKDELKPKYFMLENVKMKQEYQNIISDYLGVRPVVINSSLVSAQNRVRLYWTNIPGDNNDLFNSSISQPIDKGIMLKDIVFDDALFGVAYQFPHGCTKGGIRTFEKSPTLTKQFHNNLFPVCMHNLYGGFNEKKHMVFIGKSPTIRTAAGGSHIPSLLLSDKAIDYMNRYVKDGRTHWDFKHHSDVKNDKSAAIVANFFKGVPYNVLKDFNCIRKFDPIECERLQTIPDRYTEGVSNTQRYKMLGNGWTIDVICHILKGLI